MLLNTMNKKLALTLGLFSLAILITGLIIFLINALITKQQTIVNTNTTVSYPVTVTFEPPSYTISQSDITQALGKILITPELRAEFYNTISADYKLEQTDECTSKLTNTTFPNLNLVFNNCEWGLNITQNTDNILRTGIPEYFQQSIVFTNKASNNSVKVNLEDPFFWEGSPESECTSDTSKIQKITDDIYRVKDLDNLYTAYSTEYISREHIILKGDDGYDSTIEYHNFTNPNLSYTQEELESLYCINWNAYIPVSAQFSEQAVQVYKRMTNMHVSRGVIGGMKLTSQDSQFVEKANELVRGFEF